MNRTFLLTFVLFSVFVFLAFSGICLAEDTLKDILSKNYQEEKDICSVVKKTITEGMNAQDVTRTSIQLGHDTCLVIKCAIEAQGSLEQIISGALEAGATSDVCSRCAIDAGADPIAVAKVFETGLGYSPPLAAVLTPVEIRLPGGDPAGGVISPSAF
ncbi:MAG: hypothetical protein AB1390_07720 [Nitrospirota bacterium]